jgi:hypothetical protein
MFKLSTLILLTLLASFVSADQKTNNSEIKQSNFTGYAYNLETNKLVYTEHHTYINPLLHEVRYKETNGEIFATKNINYKYSYFAPDFIQKNSRNGEAIDIKRKNQGDGKNGIEYWIQYQENSKENLKKETISYNPRLIIDAGFDHFIPQNWQMLEDGKELTIDYLIPSRLDYYELTIKKEACKAKNSSKPQDQPFTEFESEHCFSISASSFFIGLFSSQLELTYGKKKDSEGNNRNNIKLMNFQGRSNISDSDGNYQDVNIVYQYTES